jgi:hypothetical protein
MSILGFLWPMRAEEGVINPEELFHNYEASLTEIEKGKPTTDDVKLLAQSWKMFDNETGRRTTIDSRASAIMPALGLVVTVVTGVGFTILKDNTISLDARIVILAAFVIALVYLVRTMLLVFLVHGKVYRGTLDPSEIVPPQQVPAGEASPYDRAIAIKLLGYTIGNYKANNTQSDNLFVAQQVFRNAIITLALGGVITVILIFAHGSVEAPTENTPKPVPVIDIWRSSVNSFDPSHPVI